MSKRMKIRGIRRKDLDYDTISYVLWVMAKRQVEERRKRDAVERARRGERS